MSLTGEHLYQLVQAYSALGVHRTGTPVDQATIEWFGNELVNRGARIDKVPYRFKRYVADCRLIAHTTEVEALPLYYESVRKVNSSRLHLAELAIVSNLNAPQLDDVLGRARISGADAAVLAATGAGGRLVALNRAPTLGSGFPTVLVPGCARQMLTQAPIHLELDARLEPSESATVIGHLGQANLERPVVLTTPLSGWFHCAGERGTGIAITLQLAEQLAEHWPVMIVGTTGHELHFLGLRRFLRDANPRPVAVVHLGASLAAAVPGSGGSLALAPTRQVLTTAGEELAKHLEAVLTPAILTVQANPPQWAGEGEEWARLGMPILSFVGIFPLFHTPEDLPQHATSPELLEVTSTAVSQAAQLFLEESVGR
jgi:hypothetical protein